MKSALLLILLLSGCSMVSVDERCHRVHPLDGDIDQCTGLVLHEGRWRRSWWSDQFDAAKVKGCRLEDSCGIFPPSFEGAQYCGEPREVCR